MMRKKKRNEEKDGKQATEYQEHHDTYAMKIKENLITVNDLFYKYRRILIVKDIRKASIIFLCVKKDCNGVLSFP